MRGKFHYAYLMQIPPSVLSRSENEDVLSNSFFVLCMAEAQNQHVQMHGSSRKRAENASVCRRGTRTGQPAFSDPVSEAGISQKILANLATWQHEEMWQGRCKDQKQPERGRHESQPKGKWFNRFYIAATKN